MTKIPKNYINTSFFHIMVQGLNKEYIFNSNIDKDKYLKIMNKIIKDVNLEIIVYCIMDNHIHILIKTENIEQLSKFMQRVNTLYARYYNEKYNRVGYVFCNRFKRQIIYTEKQLYICINYIHNNPVKAKMCNYPYEYKYSSFREYTKNIKFFQSYINKVNFEEDDRDILFLEIDDEREEDIRETINQFLLNNNLNLKELLKNKEKLKEIICLLKNKYNLSIRKISEYLNVGRETIRKLVKVVK